MTDSRKTETRPLSRWALCALAACSSFVAAGLYSVSPALAPMHDHFEHAAGAEWLLPLIGGIVPLAFALSSPFVGLLIEKLGIRRVFAGSLLLFAVAGTAPALLDDLALIVALRALVGMAVAGILNAGITGTGLLHEPSRSKMFGLISMLGAISGVCFFPLAGLLASLNWRAVFAIPLIALAVLPFALHLPQRGAPSATTAPVGTKRGAPIMLLLLAAFIGLITYAAPMFSPFYLREMGLTSPAMMALPLMAMSTCSLTVSAGYALWRRLLGRRGIFIAGQLLLGSALLIAGNVSTLPTFAVAMAIFGAGLGCTYPNLNATSVHLGRENAARVVAQANASLYGSQVLFPYLAKPVQAYAGTAAVFWILGASAILIAGLFALSGRLTASQE